MGLLKDRNVVVTGVLTERSIAFQIASAVLAEGADLVITTFARVRRHTERAARRLPVSVPILDLDVTAPEDFQRLAGDLRDRWGRVDGVVHSIAHGFGTAMGTSILEFERGDVQSTFQVSAVSFAELARAMAPLMERGGSIVGLDFDARFAWPGYNWMGVAKAALESSTHYLARDLGPLGVRANLIAAGPVRSVAASAVPGFADIQAKWDKRAPLGWHGDTTAVARCAVALLSDLLPATTGEIIHVDGGAHCVAA